MEEELKEILRYRKHMRAGKIDENHIDAEIKIFQETGRYIDRMFKVHSMLAQSKREDIIVNRMVKQGLIGNGQIIDMSPEEIEEEKIHCEDQGKIITRAECCSRSGNKDHFDDCKDCDYFNVNRKLVFGPDKPYEA